MASHHTDHRAARPLADDLLESVAAIAAYTGIDERRCRHLVATGRMPVKRIGAKITSRKSWLDAMFAEPDQPAGKGRAA